MVFKQEEKKERNIINEVHNMQTTIQWGSRADNRITGTVQGFHNTGSIQER